MTVGELLQAALDASPLSISEIARRAGIGRAQVYSITSGASPNPGINTIGALADAMGLPAVALMPPGLTPWQHRALAATATGDPTTAARRLTGLIGEILDSAE